MSDNCWNGSAAIKIFGELVNNLTISSKGQSNPETRLLVYKGRHIELLYAMQRKGSINNGQAELKDIAQFFEAVFGINLGNYYHTFQEIRICKSGRTNYLDQLKTTLLQYMDETDLHYHK